MKNIVNFTAIFLFFCIKATNHHVTFIMPCYNCSSTIKQAIDSIFVQNLTIPFEIICTDDGSSDNTIAILESYKNIYSNFVYFKHSKNMGGGAARNTCIKYAKGNLIFCLDSDNILAPNSINDLITLLDSSGCEAAAFGEWKIFDQDSPLRYLYSVNLRIPKNNIFDLNCFMTEAMTPPASGNYLYKKSSYLRAGGYPEDCGAMDAWGFGFKQLATGTKIAVLQGSYYWHRISTDSYWTREERVRKNDTNALRLMRSYKAIFDAETNKLLFSEEIEKVRLFSEIIEKGKIKLIADELLPAAIRSFSK